MTYLSAKKIYPGNWAEALNGWYRNIDTSQDGTNDGSNAGPTSVLAQPGWRFFQQRGYVEVANSSGDGATATGTVIVPSPYKNDDTRPNITGMFVSGNSTLPCYGYRATISVASGWDGTIASGVYTSSGQVIAFGADGPGPTSSATAPCTSAILESGTTDTGLVPSGTEFFAGNSAGYSEVPLPTATGVIANFYTEITGSTEFKVFNKASGEATTTTGGFFISDADKTAKKKGYIVVEVCYIQPDTASDYNWVESYLKGRTVS